MGEMQTITNRTAVKQGAVHIAVSSLVWNDIVGIGSAIEMSASVHRGTRLITFSSTLGMRSEQNPYSGELAVMVRALSSLPKLRFRSIAL